MNYFTKIILIITVIIASILLIYNYFAARNLNNISVTSNKEKMQVEAISKQLEIIKYGKNGWLENILTSDLATFFNDQKINLANNTLHNYIIENKQITHNYSIQSKHAILSPDNGMQMTDILYRVNNDNNLTITALKIQKKFPNTLTLSGNVVGKNKFMLMRSDKIIVTELDNKKHQLIATGNKVHLNITFPRSNKKIATTAKKIVYNTQQKNIKLFGKVKLLSATQAIEGNYMIINMIDETFSVLPDKNNRQGVTITIDHAQ